MLFYLHYYDIIIKETNEKENHNQRENWVYLGEAWLMFGNYYMALAAFDIAIKITDRTFSPECEEWCWDDNYVKEKIKMCQMSLKL